MSFILDALKKSENERQQQSTAEFAGIPTTSADARMPRWLWLLGLLLAVNLAVLIGLLMRPETPPIARSTIESTPQDSTARTPTETFAEQVAAARRNAPPVQASPQPAAEGSVDPVLAANIIEPTVVASDPDAVDLTGVHPTIQEVRAKGALSLPDLSLDIHVYSEQPEDRFVFINMTKYRERATLDAGPSVEEITPNGVVLRHRGVSFLLPRE